MIKNLILITVLLICFSCNVQQSKDLDGVLDKEVIESIDSLFSDFNNLQSPGYAIGIVKDTATLYTNGYGAANLEYNLPIDENTAFDIASVSKQFTAACMALLILDGKISLDSPVQNFIPELAKYQDTLRIKHLIYNTSGITDYFRLPRNNHQSWLDFYYFDINEAINTSLQKDTLSFKPGEKWDYSNINYMLLTKVVEKVSGKTFTEFIQSRLFTPLKMKNTLVNDDITTIIPNRATPYNPRVETPDIVYHPRWVKVTIAGRTKVTHLRRVKVDHL